MGNLIGGKKGGAANRPPAHAIVLHVLPTSAPSRAAWLYLLQNGFKVDLKKVSLMDGDNKTDEFTKLNPLQKVPVMQDGETTIYESQAIVRYLAKKYCQGKYLGGKDLGEQTKIDEVMCWATTSFYMNVGYHFVYPQVFMGKSPDDFLVALGEKSFRSDLDLLEKHYLANTDFVCGNSPSAADLFLAVYVSLGEWVAFDFSTWPKVVEWFRRMKLLPHWKEVHEAHRAFAKEKSGTEPEQPEPPKAAEEAKPAEEKKEEEAAKPTEEAEKPAEEAAKPAEEETKPAEEAKPAEEEAKPAEEEAKPAEEETKPAEEEAKPAEEGGDKPAAE